MSILGIEVRVCYNKVVRFFRCTRVERAIMEPVDFEVEDWQERGFTQEPVHVFVADEIQGELTEVGPGIVIDESVDREQLWREFMVPLGLEGWWWLRDAFIRDGLDYYKYFQVGRENIADKALGEDGVPRLSAHTRRRINGFWIGFWDDGRARVKEKGLVEKAWKPSVETPVPLVRCVKYGEDGLRCGNWSIRGGTVCSRHGGGLPSVRKSAEAVLEAARNGLVGAVPTALDTLVELTGVGNPEGVRLKAAESLLDRAGIKGGIEIEVNVGVKTDATEQIMGRLASIAGRNAIDVDDDGDIVDAEVISDEELD